MSAKQLTIVLHNDKKLMFILGGIALCILALAVMIVTASVLYL
jgi:hypothetical protein